MQSLVGVMKYWKNGHQIPLSKRGNVNTPITASWANSIRVKSLLQGSGSSTELE
jgi:hypothetical protein